MLQNSLRRVKWETPAKANRAPRSGAHVYAQMEYHPAGSNASKEESPPSTAIVPAPRAANTAAKTKAFRGHVCARGVGDVRGWGGAAVRERGGGGGVWFGSCEPVLADSSKL